MKSFAFIDIYNKFFLPAKLFTNFLFMFSIRRLQFQPEVVLFTAADFLTWKLNFFWLNSHLDADAKRDGLSKDMFHFDGHLWGRGKGNVKKIWNEKSLVRFLLHFDLIGISFLICRYLIYVQLFTLCHPRRQGTPQSPLMLKIRFASRKKYQPSTLRCWRKFY